MSSPVTHSPIDLLNRFRDFDRNLLGPTVEGTGTRDQWSSLAEGVGETVDENREVEKGLT